jgi:Nif-specific regulatory protein
MSPESASTTGSARQPHDLGEAGLATQRLLLNQVAQASATGTSVTLMGEPGSGRMFFARAIHRASPWAIGPLVQVECDKSPDIPAITQGIRSPATLLLVEVGELTLEEQATLARVLAHDAFRRDDHCVQARIRLLATTSTNLDEAVERAAFRADLYHRLTVMTIVVPPLRERRGVIASLTDEFVRRLAIVHRKRVSRVSARAMVLLARYSWPGNVQELTDAIEYAVVSCEGETVHAHHLPMAIRRTEYGSMHSESLEDAVNAYECELIQDALRSARGSRSKAARLLKTTYRILHYKTRKYGIDHRQFKA